MSEVHDLLVGASAEDLITILREMCIEREISIDGEWGDGKATVEELGEQIDKELAQRLLGRVCRPTKWQCVCAGQGGSVYSAMCPIHDHTVNTSDSSWRRWYDEHLEAQARIKERLGW